VCGIAGLIARDGTPDPSHVERMIAALVHRGPDDGSVDVYGRCVLGHRRLKVVDLESGYQPAENESGSVACVFNGELYNFRELRRELSGHELRGTGDTAVVPHLYEEHGPGLVERLEGMFALALWDSGRERLLLARDRVGKKPLLWTTLPDGTLAFASELKGLLQLPGLARELDLDAIDAYLALQYVPASRTPLRGVAKLPPGHVLVWEEGSCTVTRYWDFVAQSHEVEDAEWLDRVRATVTAAVRRRLVADVPLGALLSGGIDSSIVVGLMAQASPEPVRTFTVGFADERYDERPYARAVAERWGTQHEEVFLEPDAAEVLPRLAAAFDEPLGDEAALAQFLVCEAARRSVTVALTGDGGDESFAGYERYAAHALARRVPSVAARLGAGALRLLPAARTEPRSTPFRAARLLDTAAVPAAERYERLMTVFPPGLRRELWTADRRVRERHLAATDESVTALQRLDVETYLPGDLLLKADLASMAHSLELRSPLLDHHVLELGLSLPDHLKLDGRTGKIALRRAFAEELTPVESRGKTGFGVPIGRWFRGELRELAHDLLLGRRARERGWFRPAAIERLLTEHTAGRADHAHRLWCLVMLELWLRTWVEAERPAPSLATS
jgi:asparagine synthase (glutamine-hydrolysing)